MPPVDTNNSSESRGSNDPLHQLNKLQAIIEVEKELTRLIEKAQPWIQSSLRTAQHTGANCDDSMKIEDDFLFDTSIGGRVRPIPTNMEQVQEILSLARTYSNRTSAPPGWISTAPVLNFSTPSPLPHQLRNGALAALQLQRALQQQKQQRAVAAAQRAPAAPPTKVATPKVTEEPAPEVHPSSAKTQLHNVAPPAPIQPLKRPRQEITMNLSDDSSSDDE